MTDDIALRGRGALAEFLTPDLERLIAFYRDQLGFRLCSTYGDPVCFAIVDTHTSGIGLHLKLVEGHTPQSNRAADDKAWDVFFEVEGLDAWHAQIAARGVTALRGPENAPYGMREVELADPDGYVLCFAERLAD